MTTLPASQRACVALLQVAILDCGKPAVRLRRLKFVLWSLTMRCGNGECTMLLRKGVVRKANGVAARMGGAGE